MDPPNLALISLDISTEAASEIKTNTYEAFSTHLPVVREVYNFIKWSDSKGQDLFTQIPGKLPRYWVQAVR